MFTLETRLETRRGERKNTRETVERGKKKLERNVCSSEK